MGQRAHTRHLREIQKTNTDRGLPFLVIGDTPNKTSFFTHQIDRDWSLTISRDGKSSILSGSTELEGKLVQPLWRTIWQGLLKWKIHRTHDPAILVLTSWYLLLKMPCRCAERHKGVFMEQHLQWKLRSNLKGSIHRTLAKKHSVGETSRLQEHGSWTPPPPHEHRLEF